MFATVIGSERAVGGYPLRLEHLTHPPRASRPPFCVGPSPVDDSIRVRVLFPLPKALLAAVRIRSPAFFGRGRANEKTPLRWLQSEVHNLVLGVFND